MAAKGFAHMVVVIDMIGMRLCVVYDWFDFGFDYDYNESYALNYVG